VVLFISDRGAKGSALDWPECVEVAGTGFRVEDGAGLIVGEVREGFLMLRLGKEQTRSWVSWEHRQKACLGFGYARDDALGNIGLSACEAFAELLGIKLRYGEYTDAALMTAGSAGEPIAGALGGGSECSIENGEEVCHQLR
jgi:hypothetical protein